MDALIQEAILAVQMKDYETAFDALEEAEYQLLDVDMTNLLNQEIRDLVSDCKMLVGKEHVDEESLSMYLYMTLDILTLPETDGYVFDKEMFDELAKGLYDHVNNGERSTKTDRIEWEMKFKRLGKQLREEIIAEHNRRYGEFSSLRRD